jgi:hypothetical protein
MVLAGALVAATSVVWMAAVRPEQPSHHVILRVMCAGLAVALTGVAGMRLFWNARRGRHPVWHRAWAIVELLLAAYMVAVAIRGL